MKKAFCEPKNIDFCPPISIASAFSFGLEADSAGVMTISRTPENGGDVVFNNRLDLEASFANGSLHPGDLKAFAALLIVSTLENLSKSIKSDSEATKSSKTLKAAQKKLAKKKKKQ